MTPEVDKDKELNKTLVSSIRRSGDRTVGESGDGTVRESSLSSGRGVSRAKVSRSRRYGEFTTSGRRTELKLDELRVATSFE